MKTKLLMKTWQETNRTPLAAASLAPKRGWRMGFDALVAVTLAFHTIDAGGQQPAGTNSPPFAAGRARYIEGELLVKIVGGVAKSQIATSPHAVLGATVLGRFAAIGWDHVRLPEGMSVGQGDHGLSGIAGCARRGTEL